jgi:hypothetical protein
MLTIRTSKCNTIIKKPSSALFLWLHNSKGWFVGKPEVMASCRDTKIIYEDAGPKLTARHQAQLRPVPWQSRCTCALLTRCWKPQAQTLRAE